MHARRAQRVRHAHQFAIACVAGDKAQIGAPHANAFAHVLQRRLQQVALLAQFAFLRLELGDVGGDDRGAAVGEPVLANLDPGAVEDLALQHRLGIAMMLHAPADEALDIRAGIGIASRRETGAQQVFERGAGNQQILDRIGNAAIGVVAGDEPVIGVEQRERVGQAADRRGELLLRLVGARFRLDGVGQVAAGAAISGHAAFGIENRSTADREIMELAVAIAPCDAHVAIGAPRLEQLDMLRPLGGTQILGHFLKQRAADHVLRPQADGVEDRRRDISEALLGVALPEPVGGGFREIAQLRFGRLDLGFRLPPFRDVAVEADETAIGQRRAAHVDDVPVRRGFFEMVRLAHVDKAEPRADMRGKSLSL